MIEDENMNEKEYEQEEKIVVEQEEERYGYDFQRISNNLYSSRYYDVGSMGDSYVHAQFDTDFLLNDQEFNNYIRLITELRNEVKE